MVENAGAVLRIGKSPPANGRLKSEFEGIVESCDAGGMLQPASLKRRLTSHLFYLFRRFLLDHC
jgi:hypothetical protein